MFRRKINHKNKCFRPAIRHSQLLALEPRQVFDAAVGAAVAEVLAPAQETAEPAAEFLQENAGADHQAGNVALQRLGGDGGESPTSSRAPGFGPPAVNSEPMFILAGPASAAKDQPFALKQITVQDNEGDNLTLTLTVQNGGSFFQGDKNEGATLTLGGTEGDTAANINAALAKYTFKPTGNQAGTARVIYGLTDGQPGHMVEKFFDITVTKINTRPTVAFDDEAFSADMRESSTGNIKGLTVGDADGDRLTVTITAVKKEGGNGLFKIGAKAGVQVDYNDANRLVLKGTAAGVNALLETLQYTTPASIGEVTLTVAVEDGTAGAQPVAVSRTILVNDAPTIAVHPKFNGVISEYSSSDQDDTDNKLFLGGPAGLSIHDPNAGDTLKVEVTLNDPGQPPLGALYYDGQECREPSAYTVSGDYAAVNAALEKLCFRGAENRSGKLSFSVKVTDSQGATVEETRDISVTPVNDPPTLQPGDWLNVYEGNRHPTNSPGRHNNVLTLAHLGLGGRDGAQISDPDTPPDQVMVTLRTLPDAGQLKKGEQLLGRGATFSLQDVLNGTITYEHSGNQAPVNGLRDGFRFTVDDGSGAAPTDEAEVKIKLNPYNDDFSIASRNAAESGGGLVVWAWERQTDAGLFSVKPTDVMPGGGLELLPGDDKPENIAVTFTKLPTAGQLYVVRNGARVNLDAGHTVTGAELGQLYFQATDSEPGFLNPDDLRLTMTVTDRQGIDRGNDYGFTVDEALDKPREAKTVEVLIKIAPNNDDPALGSRQLGSENDRVLINHEDGARRIVIDPRYLEVTDADSLDQQIVFTLTNVDKVTKYGELLLERNGAMSRLRANDCFTMDDVKNNRLVFEYWRPGDATGYDSDHDHTLYDLTPSFSFTVQDGGVTSWLPDDDSGRYGDEAYHTSHEGGLYEPASQDGGYRPDSPGAENKLREVEFSLFLTACHRVVNEDQYTYVDPHRPEVAVKNINVPLIYEGRSGDEARRSYFTLTGDYYKDAGTPDGQVMIQIMDNDTPPEQLVLSLLNSPKGGHLVVGGVRIFVGDSFTLRELMDQQVTYVHEGGECFQDQLDFAVSDGAYYVRETTTPGQGISLAVNIIPYDDAPSLAVADSSKLVVDEGGVLTIKGVMGPVDGQGSKNGLVRYYDPDNKDAVGSPAYRHEDGLDLGPNRPETNRSQPFGDDVPTFTITALPGNGSLYYQGDDQIWRQVVSQAPDPEDPEKPFILKDALTITTEALDQGRLEYRHDGLENRNDEFTIMVNDNSEEAGGPLTATLKVPLVVRAVNDAPVLQTPPGQLTGRVTESKGAAGKVHIKGQGAASGELSLVTIDQDNDAAQIIYRITEPCASGVLYLQEGSNAAAPLGPGSCFTQDDLDKGRIYYQHSGKNQHRDAFKFVITDNSLYYNSDVNAQGQTAEPLTYTFTVDPVNQEPSIAGMTRLDVYYKDTIGELRIYDEKAADGGGKQFITVDDADQNPNNGYVNDPNVSQLDDEMELTITAKNGNGNWLDKGALRIGSEGQSGVVVTSSEGGSVLVLKGSRDQLNRALEHLYFQAQKSDDDFDLDQVVKLHFELNDRNNGRQTDEHGQLDPGKALTASHTLTIHVSTVNDVPETVKRTDSTVTIPEDEARNIFGQEGGALHHLSFKDVDTFDSTDNTLKISSRHGRLSLGGPDIPGLTGERVTIQGQGSELVLTGALPALNQALTQVLYAGANHFNGSDDTITVTYTDGGPLNPEAPASDDQKAQTVTAAPFTVTVTPVNDRPSVELRGFASHLDQVAHGQFTRTVPMTADNWDSGHSDYRLDLNGKIKIADANDFGKQGLSLDWDDSASAPNKSVAVTVQAGLLRYENSPAGAFSLAGAAMPNLTSVIDNAASTITLTGSWADVQQALDNLVYSLTEEQALACDNRIIEVAVKVDDHLNGDAPQVGSTNNTAAANFLINVNTGDNEKPVINGGDGRPVIYEDLFYAVRPGSSTRFRLADVFPGGVEVADEDSFDEKMLFKLEISGGALYLDNVRFAPAKYYSTAAHGTPAWNTAGATLADIKGMLSRMEVQLTPNFNGPLTLTLTVNDKGHTGTPPADAAVVNGGRETSKVMTIEVRPVNDAPTVTDASEVSLGIIDEDAAVNEGRTVTELFLSRFADARDDQAGQTGSFAGVLVVGNAAASDQGQWQYHDGSAWQPLPVVGEDAAFYLSGEALLRFAPAENFNGQPGQLTVRLVEETPVSVPSAKGDAPGDYPPFFGLQSRTGKEAVTGQVFNLTATSGDFGGLGTAYRPYTDQTVKLGITVTAVNDAPVISGGAAALPLYEDLYFDPQAHNTVKLSEIFAGPDALKAADLDCPADQKLRFSLSLDHPQASLTYNSAPFTEGDYTLADIEKILAGATLTWPADFNGDLKLTMTVNDQGQGSALGDPDPREDSKTLIIKVRPANDAPTVTDASEVSLGIINEDAAVNEGRTVTELFSGRFADARDDQAGQTGSFAGVLVVGNAAASDQGQWQYHDGSAWQPLPVVGEDAAFYLNGDTLLRFAPAENFNGQPGQLTVRLVEETPVSVPSAKGDAPGDYPPFFNLQGQTGRTGQPLTTGATFDLTMTSGDFGGLGTAYRPYTDQTVKLGVAVTAVNDAPVITVDDSSYTMLEDGRLSLTGLTISEPDAGDAGFDPAAEYRLTVTVDGPGQADIDQNHTLPSGVTKLWNAEAGALTIEGATLSQMKDLVENGGLIFIPYADQHSGQSGLAPVGLTLTLDDGFQNGAGTASAAIVIEPVNDAPQVGLNDGAAGQVIAPFVRLDKDAPLEALPTATVGSLFGGCCHDGRDAGVDDSPAAQYAFAGVALEYASPGHPAGGQWQYSADGHTWQDLPELSPGQGFFLNQAAHLRFAPQGRAGDAPELTVHLLDNSAGRLSQAPECAALTGRTGGTYDASEKTATLRASAIADQRPVWNHGLPNEIALSPTPEDPAPHDQGGVTVASIIDGRGGDVDGDGLAGLLVTGVGPTDDDQGLWEYSVDGGGNWRPLRPGEGRGLFLDRDAKIRFNPAPDYNGPVSGRLTVKLVDGDNSLNAAEPLPASGAETPLTGLADADITGRYSADPRDLTMTVAPVNDAPAAGGEASLPDQRVPAGGVTEAFTVDELFGDMFDDAKDQVNGHPGNTLTGLFVVGSQADPLAEGVWEYFDGAGWRPIRPEVADDQAIYLETTSLVRFKPVPGFSGRPGQMEARLAETADAAGHPAHTGSDVALPADLTPGGVYNLNPSLGAAGHLSGRVGLGFDLTFVNEEVPYHRPPRELDPRGHYQNQAHLWARWVREWESPAYPHFERLGLDDPHVRTAGATDGIGQEVPLITDTHIVNVNRFTTDHINQSVGQARQALHQAGHGLATARESYVDAALETALEAIARGQVEGFSGDYSLFSRFSPDGLGLTFAAAGPAGDGPEETARGPAEESDEAADRLVFLRQAEDAFGALWAAGDVSPAGETLPAPPGDRDLDDKIQACSIKSLLAESAAFLKSLV